MSHAAIVELQPYKIYKYNWVEPDVLNEDIGIQYHADYVGDIFSNKDRKSFIKNDLPELLEGIATVDPVRETITFLSAKEIEDTVKKEIAKAVSFIQRNIAMGDKTFFNFRYAGKWFRQDYTIIWSELASYTSAQFIEDAKYKEGETMYIGAIYDYHI